MAFYQGKIIKETKKRSHTGLFVLIFLLLILGVGAYFALTNQIVAEKIELYRCYVDTRVTAKVPTMESKVQAVTIPAGSDPYEIGLLLQQKGIITNARDFLCYVRKINAGNKIQAGYYEIQLPVSIEQVVQMLQSARIPTFRVTLQEGLRMDEIATKIDNAMGQDNSIRAFDKEEFLRLIADPAVISTISYAKGKKNLEGFLFPDTYEIAKNATSREVLDLLTANFTRRVNESTDLASSKIFTPYQIITFASILEKEAGKSYDEKRTIAGILEKRLQAGWLLEVDATFLYEKKDWKAPITAADKLKNTPYNTYLRKGLPPTPISNPGVQSIQAALNPIETDYWFYLHGKDGQVHYAKTYNEHLQNVANFL